MGGLCRWWSKQVIKQVKQEECLLPTGLPFLVFMKDLPQVAPTAGLPLLSPSGQGRPR